VFGAGHLHLPFRSNRTNLIRHVSRSVVDAARSTWLFWAGMGRFLFGLSDLFGGSCGLWWPSSSNPQRIVGLPFALTGVLTKIFAHRCSLDRFPHAVVWSGIEAIIFSYIDTDLFRGHQRIVGTSPSMLSLFLGCGSFFMILGSFACLHVLTEAVSRKDVKQIIQMLVVEVFRYVCGGRFSFIESSSINYSMDRPADRRSNGYCSPILFASFAWVGVRGMVWFLFGRFGTPTLLALISRQRLTEEGTVSGFTHGSGTTLE